MVTARLLRAELRNLLRSRWVIGYALLYLLLSELLFRFGGSGNRAVLSLMNLVLALVPLASIVFGTMYLYQAREFIQLLLAQPVGRRALYVALYGGLVLPLGAGFLLGTGLPMVLHGGVSRDTLAPLLVLLAGGLLLTAIFTALAFVVSLSIEDRARGLGLALLLWFLCAVAYDGIILLVIAGLSGSPLEAPLLAMTAANPVDLMRVLLLQQFDIAALLGYTGLVFERFFRSPVGIAATAGTLLLWLAGPWYYGLRRFVRKDL